MTLDHRQIFIFFFSFYPQYFAIVAMTRSIFKGFARCAFIPASILFFASSSNAHKNAIINTTVIGAILAFAVFTGYVPPIRYLPPITVGHYSFSIRFNSGSTVQSIVIKQILPPITFDTGSARNTPSVPICNAYGIR